jgi:DNA-binding transcriptional ArsR family regulator
MPDPPSQLLAHPLRDRLLFEYQGEAISPSDVARRTGERLNLVSYHTGVLAKAGWLELVRTERRRGGIARLYRATSPAFIEADAWPSLPSPLRRALVRGVLATTAEESRRAALEGGFDGAHVHATRWPVGLDDQGALEVSRLLRQLVDDLTRIQAESDARGAGAPRRTLEVVLLGFRASGEVDARSG